jgi:serine/threonine protein kinase
VATLLLPTPRPGLAEERLAEGRLLAGRYRIVRFIAGGGMGAVYEVEDLLLREHVALKAIRKDLSRDERAIERFLAEINLARRVTHPNVCRIFEAGFDEDVAFLTMELHAGETLADRLARVGRMSTVEALPLVEQMVAALAAAHRAGVIHGDFKPSNILLVPGDPDEGEGERVVVTDFGLAQRCCRDMCIDRPDRGIVGTPAYMSPEQAGGLDVDARSDVYSLGAIMYELLCGQPLFNGKSFGEFVVKHMNEAPIPPRQTPGGRDMPAQLEAIILRSLAKQKDQRYHAASALRDDIVTLLATMDTGMVSVKALVASAQMSGQLSDRIATPNPPRTATPTPGRTGIPIGVAGPNAPSAQELLLDVDEDNTEPKPVETRLTAGDLQATGVRRPVRLAWFAVAAIAAAAIGVVIYRYVSTPPATIATTSPATESPPKPPAAQPEVKSIKPDPVKVSFSTDPSGADVFPYGSDARICTTPCSTDVDPNDGGDPKQRTFILRKAGFVEHQEDVSLTDGPAAIDAILLAPDKIMATPDSSASSRRRDKDRDRDRDRDRDKDRDRDREKADPSPSPVATPAPTPPPGSDKIDRTETLDPFQNKGP